MAAGFGVENFTFQAFLDIAGLVHKESYFYTLFFTQANWSLLVGRGLGLVGVGLVGLGVTGSTLVILLVSIELVRVGVGFLFFAGVVVWGSPVGLLFLFVLLACAAAETAIGLSLLAVWYRFDGSPLVRALVGLRG